MTFPELCWYDMSDVWSVFVFYPFFSALWKKVFCDCSKSWILTYLTKNMFLETWKKNKKKRFSFVELGFKKTAKRLCWLYDQILFGFVLLFRCLKEQHSYFLPVFIDESINIEEMIITVSFCFHHHLSMFKEYLNWLRLYFTTVILL